MDCKDFMTEMLKRLTALRVKYVIINDTMITCKMGKNKWIIKALEPVSGDDRKSIVELISATEDKVVFEKPCTTYYLLQYLVGHSGITK